jgi:hypothetical protein
MGAVLLACAANALYIAGFAVFKTTAGRMRRLTADHPVEVVGQVLGNARWVLALLVILAALALDCAAFTQVPLAATLPVAAVCSLLVPLIAYAGFGERYTARELAVMAVIVLAMLTLALPVLHRGAGFETLFPGHPGRPPMWKVALYAAPAGLIPLVLFVGRDSIIGGRHARRLTGVAYGIGAGVQLGAALVSGVGIAALLRHDPAAAFSGPFPYIVLVVGGLGLGLLQIALQRCRMGIVVGVVSITAYLYLDVAGTFVYGQPGPHGMVMSGLRFGGLALTLLGLLALPKHEAFGRPAVPERRPAGHRRRALSTS